MTLKTAKFSRCWRLCSVFSEVRDHSNATFFSRASVSDVNATRNCGQRSGDAGLAGAVQEQGRTVADAGEATRPQGRSDCEPQCADARVECPNAGVATTSRHRRTRASGIRIVRRFGRSVQRSEAIARTQGNQTIRRQDQGQARTTGIVVSALPRFQITVHAADRFSATASATPSSLRRMTSFIPSITTKPRRPSESRRRRSCNRSAD